MEKINLSALLIMIFAATSCMQQQGDGEMDMAYLSALEAWKKQRIDDLMKPDSWLSLVGLFWLNEGVSKFGNDVSNDIIFPEPAPPFIGEVVKQGDSVTMKVFNNLPVTSGNQMVEEISMQADSFGKFPNFEWNALSWTLIKRGDKYGIRLRNAQSEAFRNFKPIEYYPADRKWCLQAEYIKYEPGKKVVLENALGMQLEYIMSGYLEFEINNTTYKLDVMEEGEELFVIFFDSTSGTTTYGGGRYLYAANPGDAETLTTLDFNQAYNPPCVFTDFATCLLPPLQNQLDIAVTAGELDYGSH